MRLRRVITAAAALAVSGLLLGVLTGGSGPASAAPPTPTDSEVQKQLAQVRQATARYQNIENAIADGYVAFTPCVDAPDPSDGAMGFHYARLDLMRGEPIMLEPDILVYFPQGKGKLRLVAVEWFQVNGERPVLFAQDFDDGPSLEGHPLLNTEEETYALHAWVWHPNPSGMFAQFNSSLRCPAE